VAGSGFTVAVTVLLQPVAESVKVMVALPAVIPVTLPEDDPTMATAVLALIHVPVPPIPVNVVESAIHIIETPVTDGSGLTVIV
jgi:hypothetical protein